MEHYFTARVELNNHDTDDYKLLHEELAKISFFRAILADNNNWYDLPTGEYIRITENTLNEIRDILVKILKAFIARKPINDKGLAKSYEFLLGQSENLSILLRENTDVSKRPKQFV